MLQEWLSELGFMGFRDFQDRRFAFRLNAHRIWARMPQISAWRGWYRTDGRTNSTGRFSGSGCVGLSEGLFIGSIRSL